MSGREEIIAEFTSWLRSPNVTHEEATVGFRILGELRRAHQDTERLDWREAHPKHGFGLYDDGKWADGKGGSHDTYRAALDAARKEEAPR